MTTFKVGDKVRLKENDKHYGSGLPELIHRDVILTVSRLSEDLTCFYPEGHKDAAIYTEAYELYEAGPDQQKLAIEALNFQRVLRENERLIKI